MDIVTGLHSTLLSGVNFADIDYVTILDKAALTFMIEKQPKSSSQKKTVLSGYRAEEGLWRTPLKKNVQNINTDTFLIQCPSPN